MSRKRHGGIPPRIAARPQTLLLDNGKVLERGTEFTVKGHGRHRVMAIRPNGEVNAWGPIRKLTKGQEKAPTATTRTFKPTQIARIH